MRETTISHRNQIRRYFQPLAVTAFLYPLERIQTIKQIQSTYNNNEIKQCKEIFTRATHYGIKSCFRGLIAYMFRVSTTYISFQTVDLLVNRINQGRNLNSTILEGMKCLGIALGYLVVYPFENIRIRIGADVERERVYSGIRDCISKMRKIQGGAALYQGSSLGAVHIVLQYTVVSRLYNRLLNRNQGEGREGRGKTGIPQFMIAYFISELLLYPLDSIKKIVQINGSLGHSNNCPRYRDVLSLHRNLQVFRGLGIRLTNSLLYSAMSLWMLKRVDSN